MTDSRSWRRHVTFSTEDRHNFHAPLTTVRHLLTVCTSISALAILQKFSYCARVSITIMFTSGVFRKGLVGVETPPWLDR